MPSEIKCLFKHQELQIFGLIFNTYMSNFHPFVIVGRTCRSEIELQSGEYSFKLEIAVLNHHLAIKGSCLPDTAL